MKNLKTLTIGFILGIAISLSSIVLAAPQQIEVLYDNIKILVNGKEITMDEQPFIKNGRTFVPLRFISEAFGAEVVWNETTSTVNVNSVTGSVYNNETYTTGNIPSLNPNNTTTTIKDPHINSNTPLPSGAKYTIFNGFKIPLEYNGEIYIAVEEIVTMDNFKISLRKTNNSLTIARKEPYQVFKFSYLDSDYLEGEGRNFIKYSVIKEAFEY